MTRHPAARRRRGFTLIELMIVVVILGILAAMAMPRFRVSSHKSKEKEADIILKQVYTLQQTYLAQTGSYAATATQLVTVGFTVPTSLRYYAVPVTFSIPLCMNSLGVWHDRAIDANGDIANGTC